MIQAALGVIGTRYPVFVPLPFTTSFVRKTLSFRNQQARIMSSQPEKQDKMEETHQHHEKSEDVMSSSFGVAYATRCEEEGFGGIIYGENQKVTKTKEYIVHENNSEQEKQQKSEASEKDK